MLKRGFSDRRLWLCKTATIGWLPEQTLDFGATAGPMPREEPVNLWMVDPAPPAEPIPNWSPNFHVVKRLEEARA
jgi:hypothetical protein